MVAELSSLAFKARLTRLLAHLFRLHLAPLAPAEDGYRDVINTPERARRADTSRVNTLRITKANIVCGSNAINGVVRLHICYAEHSF